MSIPQTRPPTIEQRGSTSLCQLHSLPPTRPTSFSDPRITKSPFHRRVKPSCLQNLPQLPPFALDPLTISTAPHHDSRRRETVRGCIGRPRTYPYKHNPGPCSRVFGVQEICQPGRCDELFGHASTCAYRYALDRGAASGSSLCIYAHQR